MRDIAFEFPQTAYYILFCFVILLLQIYLHNERRNRIQAYAADHLLPYLLVARSNVMSYIKMGMWSLIWILAYIALMGPYGNIRYLPTTGISTKSTVSDQTHEIIFLVDTSASMTVADGSNGQMRLDEVKEIMQDVVSQLKGASVAIYAFTSQLTAVVPPTLDYLFTRLMINELHMNEGDVGGTRFAPVLDELKNKTFSEPLAHSFTVMLFSDGGDNDVYDHSPPSQEALNAILATIPNPESLHLKIYTIGLGQLKPSVVPKVTTDKGKPVESQLQSQLLEKLAEHGKGEYFVANQWNHWELATKLVDIVDQEILHNRAEVAHPARKVTPIREDEKISDLYYQIPLGLAIILLLMGLMMPDVRKKSIGIRA